MQAVFIVLFVLAAIKAYRFQKGRQGLRILAWPILAAVFLALALLNPIGSHGGNSGRSAVVTSESHKPLPAVTAGPTPIPVVTAGPPAPTSSLKKTASVRHRKKVHKSKACTPVPRGRVRITGNHTVGPHSGHAIARAWPHKASLVRKVVFSVDGRRRKVVWQRPYRFTTPARRLRTENGRKFGPHTIVARVFFVRCTKPHGILRLTHQVVRSAPVRPVVSVAPAVPVRTGSPPTRRRSVSRSSPPSSSTPGGTVAPAPVVRSPTRSTGGALPQSSGGTKAPSKPPRPHFHLGGG